MGIILRCCFEIHDLLTKTVNSTDETELVRGLHGAVRMKHVRIRSLLRPLIKMEERPTKIEKSPFKGINWPCL